MAIQCEYLKTRKDGVVVNKVYSDYGLMIRKVGTEYVDKCAYEVEDSPHRYEELPITVEEYYADATEGENNGISPA